MGETGLEKYLGSVLDAVAEGVEIIDADGYCSFANLAAERMFGPREQLIGRRYDDTRWRLMTPDGVPIPPEEMPQAHVMRTGEPVLDTLFRAILPDGRQVVLTMNAVPFPDEGGRVVGTLVSYTDVTQRSRTERLDRTLLDIGAAVNSSFDFDTILQRALDLAVEALGCESGILFLKEGEHHERLDGSGYPRQLSGKQISLEARILAVADVVEAMSSHRPYRAALGMEAALTEVRAHAGIKFDGRRALRPILRDAFDGHSFSLKLQLLTPEGACRGELSRRRSRVRIPLGGPLDFQHP